MNHSIEERHDRRSRRWLVLLIVGLIILITIPLLFRYQAEQRVNAELALIKQAGHPITASDINQWLPLVSIEENAALMMLEATRSIVSGTPQAEFPRRGEPLTVETRQLLSSSVQSNAVALEILYGNTNHSPSRYPLDYSAGPSTLLPHLSHLKGLVQLLRADATLHMQSGDVTNAVAAILASFRVSHSLDSEPLLISQLVSIACQHIALTTIERLLSVCTIGDADLLILDQALAGAESRSTTALTTALIGERAIGNYCFTISLANLTPLGGGGAPQVQFLPAAADSLARNTGVLARDQLFYLRIMRQWIAATSLPFPDNLNESKRVNAELNKTLAENRVYFRSRMLLPSLQNATDKFADIIGKLRSARAAIAVERYRLAHGGELPQNLNELIPQFLDTVPLDPFDGAPVRFLHTESGYKVYSVGRDGKDDGGADLSTTARTTARTPRDSTFAVAKRVAAQTPGAAAADRHAQ